MRSDPEIKEDVDAELRWAPEVDETDVATKVTDGIVTLTGFVGSYYEKYKAEAAVKRIAGVSAVANDIEVRVAKGQGTSDPEIARHAVEALRRALPLEWESVQPLVHHGHITLEGSVGWQYQRESVLAAMAKINGVTGISDELRVTPGVEPEDIKHKIEDAFRRSAEIDASHVSVDAHGSEVTLRGEVRSWSERDQAQMTAWSAPGVTNVRNELTVRV